MFASSSYPGFEPSIETNLLLLQLYDSHDDLYCDFVWKKSLNDYDDKQKNTKQKLTPFERKNKCASTFG